MSNRRQLGRIQEDVIERVEGGHISKITKGNVLGFARATMLVL
jgi:hypothetical protein